MFFGISFLSSCCFIGGNYLLLVKYVIDIVKDLCDEPMWIVVVLLKCFTLCGESYIQRDGFAMGFPLGPVLSGMFMEELENTLVPTLSNHLMSWKRYVDDTNCFIKEDSIETVMSVLNGFHPSIQFAYETESNNRLSFLDVLIIRNGQNIEACFTGNLQIQTFIFIGTPLLHSSRNAAL